MGEPARKELQIGTTTHVGQPDAVASQDYGGWPAWPGASSQPQAGDSYASRPPTTAATPAQQIASDDPWSTGAGDGFSAWPASPWPSQPVARGSAGSMPAWPAPDGQSQSHRGECDA